MRITQSLCSACQNQVPANANICPHCGVSLLEPDALPQKQGRVREAVPEAPMPSHIELLVRPLPDMLKQLDSTAENHISISGVLVAFYAGSIFSGKISANAPWRAFVYSLPLLLLLLTIILSVRVFHPAGYLNTDYMEILRAKQQRMRLSSLLLQISVALVLIAIFVYLVRPAA